MRLDKSKKMHVLKKMTAVPEVEYDLAEKYDVSNEGAIDIRTIVPQTLREYVDGECAHCLTWLTYVASAHSYYVLAHTAAVRTRIIRLIKRELSRIRTVESDMMSRFVYEYLLAVSHKVKRDPNLEKLRRDIAPIVSREREYFLQHRLAQRDHFRSKKLGDYDEHVQNVVKRVVTNNVKNFRVLADMDHEHPVNVKQVMTTRDMLHDALVQAVRRLLNTQRANAATDGRSLVIRRG